MEPQTNSNPPSFFNSRKNQASSYSKPALKKYGANKITIFFNKKYLIKNIQIISPK